MNSILSEHFKKALIIMLDETFDNVQGIYLEKNTSLFETLAGTPCIAHGAYANRWAAMNAIAQVYVEQLEHWLW